MKKLLLLLLLLNTPVFAETHAVTTNFQINIPAYTNIQPLTSTVLTANLRQDCVINPLPVKYRVVTNLSETKLYLTSKSAVSGGYEYSMFEYGGKQYIALTLIDSQASLQNLTKAKSSLKAPKVLVLPVLSIQGAEVSFKGNKYELNIKNGINYIDINIGLIPPVGGNKDGIYQATIYLTEIEI
jgi:hypothetical protein